MLKDTVAHKGRHNRGLAQHQQARYHLRSGMARVALEARVTGKPAEDSTGRPLLYANEMAERHSIKRLQQWADGRATTGAFAGMDICTVCHRLDTYCRCR